MNNIIEHLEWSNHIIDIIQDDPGYIYQIVFPGEMVIESEDGLFYSSINTAIEAAIIDICNGDIQMERDLKLSLIFRF